MIDFVSVFPFGDVMGDSDDPIDGETVNGVAYNKFYKISFLIIIVIEYWIV